MTSVRDFRSTLLYTLAHVYEAPLPHDEMSRRTCMQASHPHPENAVVRMERNAVQIMNRGPCIRYVRAHDNTAGVPLRY